MAGTSGTVAVLGTGIMGLPMAANLCANGFTVRAWNRSAEKAEPLAERGATVCADAAEAVRDADIVLTMLSDGPAVAGVMDTVWDAVSPHAVWLQMSTVGIEHTERLAALAAGHDVPFVDAPVLGTKKPAEDGALVVLASGPEDAVRTCGPVFDAVGGRTITLGDAGAGTRLKLVANNWVLTLTNGTAECVALAGALGVDPRNFLDAISGGALDVPYAHVKGGAMIAGEYPVSFPLSLAAKDARLVLDAAGDAVDLGAAKATLAHLERAEQQGHGAEDMAALYYGV